MLSGDSWPKEIGTQATDVCPQSRPVWKVFCLLLRGIQLWLKVQINDRWLAPAHLARLCSVRMRSCACAHPKRSWRGAISSWCRFLRRPVFVSLPVRPGSMIRPAPIRGLRNHLRDFMQMVHGRDGRERRATVRFASSGRPRRSAPHVLCRCPELFFRGRDIALCLLVRH